MYDLSLKQREKFEPTIYNIEFTVYKKISEQKINHY